MTESTFQNYPSRQPTTNNHVSDAGTADHVPASHNYSLAKALRTPLAHHTLKYGVQTISFAAINLAFPKRTSWFMRVVLPLGVNFLLGKWIDTRYEAWVTSLEEKEKQTHSTEPAVAATL